MTPLLDAAVVLTGGRGNARSPGCVEGTGAPVEARRVLRAVSSAARAGARTLVLVGGEPTTRRELPAFLVAMARAGACAGLATNGRMLVYPALRRLLRRRVAYLRLGLWGATAAVHDHAVGVPGAFDQSFEGLRALLREAQPSLRLDVAVMVTAHSAGGLVGLVDRVLDLPRGASLSFRFVAPLGGLPPRDWPDASAASASVGAALARVAAGGAGLIGAWEGFPPCLLDGFADLRDETLRYGVPVYGPMQVGASMPLESPGARVHPLSCQDCVHEGTCPGPSRAFLDRVGEGALRPTRAVRANSFNYARVRDLPDLRIAAGACDVPGLDLEGPACRHVLLAGERGAAHYRSDTADFADPEIRRVKDDLSQLYLDRTAGAAFDDFANSMRRVRPHPECTRCPERARCPGAVRVDPEPPFQREERWLREEVSRMRGRVLDVGCGEQPYLREVSRLIAEGRIDYHGLDPDEEALQRVRASGMGGTLHHGAVEEFDFEPAYFDHVLGLRSLNHFRDLERAFGVISRLMRVEGRLVLCDVPPFAMLRSTAQVCFADEHAPVGHEHYRNWSSRQVVEFLKRFPFRVDIHRPVSRETSNQWILKLMRVRDRVDEGEAAEDGR